MRSAHQQSRQSHAHHRVRARLAWFSLGPDRNDFNYPDEWAWIAQLFPLKALSRR